MTRRERAAVVELLLCAADRDYGIRTTASVIGRDERIARVALDAWWSVPSRVDNKQACLEAAARVAEGSWPAKGRP